METQNNCLFLDKVEDMTSLTEAQAKENNCMMEISSFIALVEAGAEVNLESARRALENYRKAHTLVQSIVYEMKKDYLGEDYEKWHRKYYWGEE